MVHSLALPRPLRARHNSSPLQVALSLTPGVLRHNPGRLTVACTSWEVAEAAHPWTATAQVGAPSPNPLHKPHSVRAYATVTL